LISRSKHYFYGDPIPSLTQKATGYPAWTDGREYKTEAYAADGTTLLRKVEMTFQQRSPVSWWTGSADYAPPNDPRLVETVTTLSDTNQVSKTSAINPSSGAVGFDQYNNQTDVWEYGYGSGSPGSLLRHTQTSYLTNSYDTVNPNTTSPNASTTYHLRSLPTCSVFDAEGRSEHALLSNTITTAGHFTRPWANRSNISGTIVL
jgi:hypothetical protein